MLKIKVPEGKSVKANVSGLTESMLFHSARGLVIQDGVIVVWGAKEPVAVLGVENLRALVFTPNNVPPKEGAK